MMLIIITAAFKQFEGRLIMKEYSNASKEVAEGA
jgi:hypothetical protein